uniref:RING-type domain-containing protein n=1 Tax=Amphimedon queenslandica TaxID=400682 RepID=A0A1X7STP7_AMPQE
MATTKPPSSSSPELRHKMEEQLTCPVCLDDYTNPKTLPCLHSFCQECLERLPLDKKNETYYLSCPNCRQHAELPKDGVGAFPVAFHLNNLKEMQGLLNNRSSKVHIPAFNPPEVTCDDHGKSLELFCETCDTGICVTCQFGDHKHHKYELITEKYDQHCEKLKECLLPVERRKAALKKILSAITEREGEIRERGEGVLAEIHGMVEDMINVLRRSERKLTEQAKRVIDSRLKVLSEQKESTKKSLKLVEDVTTYVEQSLKTGSPQQVLGSKKQMMERMSNVTLPINWEELYPVEKADFELSKDIKSLRHIGDIVTHSSTALQQCRVKKVDRITPSDKTLSCSLVPVGKGDQPIHTTVTTTSTNPGVYRIQCNPSTTGTHTVKVQVYDVHLKDTSLVISISPHIDNISSVHVIDDVKGPLGVAITEDNRVIITERDGHCVTILDKRGKKVKSLGGEGGRGNVKFSYLHCLAITPDRFILVSDSNSIQKISMDGQLIKSVGEWGSGPLQFNDPYGIAISPTTGQVYIADVNNHTYTSLES